MGNKLSLTQTFPSDVRVQLPDPERVNVFRAYAFTARFRLQDQTPERRDELHRIQEEKGQYGFLCEILDSVTHYPKDIEFVDSNDESVPIDEWCKRHGIIGAEFIMAFWSVMNKGVEEKNLRKSPRR